MMYALDESNILCGDLDIRVCHVICCSIPSMTSFGGKGGGEGVTAGLGLGRWLTSKTTTIETANTPKATV